MDSVFAAEATSAPTSKSTHNLILYTRCALNTEYGFEKSVKFFHQTLLTQIDIDFSDYNVFPGSYAEDIQFN